MLQRNPALLVIAEPHLADEMRPALEARHYLVITASSGSEAICQARACCPSLIIMDLELENLDAYEMAIDFSLLPETRQTPILAMAVGDGSDDQLALAYCHGQLTKPVSPAALADGVARARRQPRAPTKTPRSIDLQERIMRDALGQVSIAIRELCQPMTLVLGYAQMLPGHLGDSCLARSDCQIIVEQVQRMACALDRLRQLAQQNHVAEHEGSQPTAS